MSTLMLTLPRELEDWVMSRAESGTYADAGDYLRELIRMDRDRTAKLHAMQRTIDEGLASGPSDKSVADIIREERDRALHDR